MVNVRSCYLYIYSDSRSVYHVQEVMKELCTAHSGNCMLKMWHILDIHIKDTYHIFSCL